MISRESYRSTDVGGRPDERVYDPKSGTWKEQVSPQDTTSSSLAPKSDSTPPSSTPNSTNPSSKVDSKKKADKQYIYTEFNTLSGELVLTSTEKSIRIKVNDTIKIMGLGKYLSGLYFVESIRRTLNKDTGYTHTLTLFKNGFGDSLKKKQSETETRKSEVSKRPADFKTGDTVRIVGDKATYSNAHEGVKVPAWVKKKDLTIKQVSKDGTKVLLMPINSWTYTSNIQKK